MSANNKEENINSGEDKLKEDDEETNKKLTVKELLEKRKQKNSDKRKVKD